MYTIMFINFSMAEMDGPQTASRLTQLLDQAKLPIPYFCCCSDFEDECFKEIALSDGMDFFLVKPVARDSLVEMLQTIRK